MTCDVYDVLIDTQRELGALLEDSPLENHLHPMPEVMMIRWRWWTAGRNWL